MSYKNRVLQEKIDLQGKLTSLGKFKESDIYLKLDSQNQYLLTIQYDSMVTYLNVLRARIALFDTHE